MYTFLTRVIHVSNVPTTCLFSTRSGRSIGDSLIGHGGRGPPLFPGAGQLSAAAEAACQASGSVGQDGARVIDPGALPGSSEDALARLLDPRNLGARLRGRLGPRSFVRVVHVYVDVYAYF